MQPCGALAALPARSHTARGSPRCSFSVGSGQQQNSSWQKQGDGRQATLRRSEGSRDIRATGGPRSGWDTLLFPVAWVSYTGFGGRRGPALPAPRLSSAEPFLPPPPPSPGWERRPGHRLCAPEFAACQCGPGALSELRVLGQRCSGLEKAGRARGRAGGVQTSPGKQMAKCPRKGYSVHTTPAPRRGRTDRKSLLPEQSRRRAEPEKNTDSAK